VEGKGNFWMLPPGERKENHRTAGRWDCLWTRDPPHEYEAALLTTSTRRTAANIHLRTQIVTATKFYSCDKYGCFDFEHRCCFLDTL